MTKIQVFIDFEAITQPFSRELGLDNDFPYAYTIGIKKGKQFKTKTSILNFNHVSEEDVYQFIRVDIIEKIHDILKLKTFLINKDTVEFVAWAPNLEKKILSKSFQGFEVKDLAKGESMSLSALTNDDFKMQTYFPTIRKDMKKTLSEKFIERRGLNQDGAIAALTGYLLFADARNIKGKFDVDTNIRSLINELIEYSKDDVLRMCFLASNPTKFNQRKIAWKELNEKKIVLARRANKLNSLLRTIGEYDSEKTIHEITQEIDLELKKISKEKSKLIK